MGGGGGNSIGESPQGGGGAGLGLLDDDVLHNDVQAPFVERLAHAGDKSIDGGESAADNEGLGGEEGNVTGDGVAKDDTCGADHRDHLGITVEGRRNEFIVAGIVAAESGEIAPDRGCRSDGVKAAGITALTWAIAAIFDADVSDVACNAPRTPVHLAVLDEGGTNG